MVFINELQRETLLLIDSLIEQNKTHDEIAKILYDNGYTLYKKIKKGYMSKTRTEIEKNGEYSFVTLIKRKNGLANWETIKLS